MNKLIAISLLFISLQSFGQLKLTGQVLDFENNPLASVSIGIVGVNASSITDDTGVFFVTLPPSIKKGDIITLRVFKEGYKTINKYITVTPLSIQIKLTRDTHLRKATSHDNITSSSVSSQASIRPNVTTQTQNQPVSVTSNFQSGGITANQVYLGRPARTLDLIAKNQLLDLLTDKNARITIICILNDKEAYDFANQVKDFLRSQSYSDVGDVSSAMIFPSDGGILPPQKVNIYKNGASITIGPNQ